MFITGARDGNFYFTLQLPYPSADTIHHIGKMTPQGLFSEIPIPTAYSLPMGITSGFMSTGSAGIWFCEHNTSRIGFVPLEPVCACFFVLYHSVLTRVLAQPMSERN